MKKVAITGANGLVGQKLVYLLKSSKDFEVIATGRGDNRLIDQSGYHYHSSDLCNKEEVEVFFETYQPDVLINPAAITQVDYCEQNREESYKVNTRAVQWLVQLCEKYNTHLIHFSTDFVFDGKNGPYSENDKVNPVSFYGKTKVESEEIVKNSKLKKWNIVRTVLVYGLTDNMSRSNFVLWVKNSLENNKEIKVVDDQVRTPTLAEDIALACNLLIESDENGIFHISGKDTTSILNFAYLVAAVFNLDKNLIVPISSSALSQAAQRPAVTGFNMNKAVSCISFQPKSLEDGLLYVSQQIDSGIYN